MALSCFQQVLTKAYIKHLITCNESLGGRLLSIHNIRFLIREVEETREAIKNNKFKEYKENFINKYNNKNTD